MMADCIDTAHDIEVMCSYLYQIVYVPETL